MLKYLYFVGAVSYSHVMSIYIYINCIHRIFDKCSFYLTSFIKLGLCFNVEPMMYCMYTVAKPSPDVHKCYNTTGRTATNVIGLLGRIVLLHISTTTTYASNCCCSALINSNPCKMCFICSVAKSQLHKGTNQKEAQHCRKEPALPPNVWWYME